jgi:hypothetical protein
MSERGLMPKSSRLSASGESLTISPRVPADMAVRHLHADVTIFEEESPAQSFYGAFRAAVVLFCAAFLLPRS